MPGKRVLMITKVDAVWETIGEFHEYWEKENLPFWVEHGAKHIGSFTNYLGSSKSQIVRLFEFEDVSQWEKFMKVREEMFHTKEGQESMKKLLKFIEKIEETLWVSVY